jgi:hypothetical protein
MELKVYIKGAGLRKTGDTLIAIRDEVPNVKEGSSYTIKRIDDNEGSCGARDFRIELNEVNGLYSRNSFKSS